MTTDGEINDAVRKYDDTEGAMLLDIDGDGDLDLVLANGEGGPSILMNDGKGVYSVLGDGFMSQFGLQDFASQNVRTGHSYGVAAARRDHRDGHLSLIFAQQRLNWRFEPTAGSGLGSNYERTPFVRDAGNDASSTSMSSQYTLAFDWDLDGDTDLLVLNRNERNQVLINDGAASFTLLHDPHHPNTGTILESNSIEEGYDLTRTTQSTDARHAVYFDASGQGLGDVFICNYGGKNAVRSSYANGAND